MAKKRDVILKGIFTGLKTFLDAQNNQKKLIAEIMMNRLKMQDTWIWKLREMQAEKEQKSQLWQSQAEWFKQNFPQEEGGFDITRPTMRMGAEGISVAEPSATEQEQRIKWRQARIRQKQAKKIPLSEQETRFLEMYPIEEEKIKEITPAQALNIISDPFKSQQMKRYYPDLYKKIETIAKQEETQIIPEEISAKQYTTEQEQTIQDNMKAYGRIREEIIQALTKRGLL